MVMVLFVLGGTLADLTGPLMDELTATSAISRISKSSTRKSSAVRSMRKRVRGENRVVKNNGLDLGAVDEHPLLFPEFIRSFGKLEGR